MMLPRHLHGKISNTRQENESLSSGSHSSPFPQTTSFTSDSYKFQLRLDSRDMIEREKEEEEEEEEEEGDDEEQKEEEDVKDQSA